ncbi:MAG: tetratricopeptide repeat protein [Calditrichaeota bacterium]|nr:tetratricopeptide repeat protein [Calditrichota bacterium]
MRLSRTETLYLGIITFAALVLRLTHLAIVRSADFVRQPIIDAAFYHAYAMQIAAGDLVGEGVFFMSPLYPYLLGLIYALFGSDPGRAMVIQALIGSGTVVILYLWARSVVGTTAALVGAAIAALYAPYLFYPSTLLTATLILGLAALSLYLFDAARQNPGRSSLLWLGGVLGISALARPLALIVMPFLWWEFFRSDRRQAAKRSGWLAIGALIILVPVGLRNLIVGGEFALTTSSAGMNFYAGNNPDATGLYWEAPFLTSAEPQFEDEEYRREASEALGRELTTREAGRYWFGRAFDWIINEPVAYLKLLGTKAFYFWNRAEFANNISIYIAEDESPLVGMNPFGYYLIAPLGLGGLILLLKRRGWAIAGGAWLWLIAYLTGGLVFFVSSEYRLPATLVLIVGSGYLITELFGALRTRQVEPALRIAALGLVLMPVSNFRTEFIARGENARMDYFNIANQMLAEERLDEAIHRFNRSLAIDPYFSEGLLRLGEAYFRAGKIDSALAVGRRSGLENPEDILKILQGQSLREAYARLGQGDFGGAMKEFSLAGWAEGKAAVETTRVSLLVFAKQAYEAGQVEASLEAFKRVLPLDTLPDPSIHYNIAFLYWQMGNPDSAESYAMRALAIDSMNVPTAYLMARIYNATDRREESERILRRVTPDSEGRHQLLKDTRARMDSLTAAGQWEKALTTYGHYGMLGYDTEPEDKIRIARLQIEVGNHDAALRLLGEAEPVLIADPKVPYLQGRAMLGLGRPDDALEAFRRAVALAPDHIEARLNLARLYLAKGSVDAAWKEVEAVSHMEIIDPKLAGKFQAILDSVKAKM